MAAEWVKDNARGSTCSGRRLTATFPSEIEAETIISAWCESRTFSLSYSNVSNDHFPGR
jgi:hypothetical protein